MHAHFFLLVLVSIDRNFIANLSTRLDLRNIIMALVSDNVVGVILRFRYSSSHVPWFFVRLSFFDKAISEELKNLFLYYLTIDRASTPTRRVGRSCFLHAMCLVRCRRAFVLS